MNRYWFEPEAFNRLYNCTRYTPEEWHRFGVPDKVIGAVYCCIGLMYEVLYFPCLYTMAGKKFIRLSCYKIMFYLGIIDVACIFINSIMDGFFAWHGNVYCDYPDIMYISGAISTGLWCSACMACMMLALNRVCDLLKPQWMEHLFGGSRAYYWLLAPSLYGLYFIIFTPPLIFSSIYDGAFFDPYVGTPATDKEIYTSWPHTINNMVVIAVLVTAYSCVCVVVIMKSRFLNSSSSSGNTMSGMQKTIVAQATMICMLILIAATVYVRMQFIETAGYMVVVGQITWQSSHGGAVFIYLFLNKSMRSEIRRQFCCSQPHQVSSTTNLKQKHTNTHTNISSNRDSHGEIMY